MSIILQAVQLQKTYGKGDGAVHALVETSLSFREGSFTSIVGRSGSGKSTLLHLLGGLDMPTAGDVRIEGRSLYALNDNERTIFRRRRVGFVFQFLLPLHLDGRRPDQPYIDEIITMLGLGDRLNHYAGELSGGQQQRVAIARALAPKPAVILADEPTGNLDGRSGEEVLALLHLSRRRFHQTLIMVTHDRQIAEGSDRIITLIDGRVGGDSEVNIP